MEIKGLDPVQVRGPAVGGEVGEIGPKRDCKVCSVKTDKVLGKRK